MRLILVTAIVLGLSIASAASAQQWTLSGLFQNPPAADNTSPSRLILSVTDQTGAPVAAGITLGFDIYQYTCDLAGTADCLFQRAKITSAPKTLANGAFSIDYQISGGGRSVYPIILVRANTVSFSGAYIPGKPSPPRIVTPHGQVILTH